MEEKLNAFFTMFTQNFSKEATHLTETRMMLEGCMYELGIEPKDLTTRFVYTKDDENCEKPYLSLFINNEKIKRQMRLLDVDAMQFKNIDIAEFDREYKTHNIDTTEPFWKRYLPEIEMEDNEKNSHEIHQK